MKVEINTVRWILDCPKVKCNIPLGLVNYSCENCNYMGHIYERYVECDYESEKQQY